MNSIYSSASTWRQKVTEKAKIFYDWLTSGFSFITLKITDTAKALLDLIRENEVGIFKETLEICHNWFTWLIGIAITLKITEAAKAFFAAKYPVIMAVLLIEYLYFLTRVLAKVTQMSRENLFSLILILLPVSIGSVLALSLISSSIAWIGLSLWLGVFLVFVHRRCSGAGPSLPAVTEHTVAEELHVVVHRLVET